MKFLALFLRLLVISVAAGSSLYAAGEVEALTEKFKAAKERALGPIHEKNTSLRKVYLAGIEDAASRAQAAGDLESVVEIREELKYFTENGEIGDSDSELLAELRKQYSAGKTAVDGELASKTDELNAIYLRELNKLQEQLTKAGNIDEALKVKGITEALASKPAAAISTPSEPSSTTSAPWSVPEPTPQVLEGGTFTDPVVFPVGRHRLRDKVTIGKRDPVKPGKVYFQEGSEISCTGDGEIFICAGQGFGYKVSFVTAVLEGGLVGDWEFHSCVFDRTPMRKGDTWAGRPHASQWKFENCTFSGKFFDKWRTKDIGYQVNRCTFDRVEFPDLEYHEGADKVTGNEWLVMRNCRFINCDIPLSVLISTRDCVFENCSFRNDERLPEVGSGVSAVLYATDSNSRLRDLPVNVKIEIKEGDEFTGQAGADL